MKIRPIQNSYYFKNSHIPDISKNEIKKGNKIDTTSFSGVNFYGLFNMFQKQPKRNFRQEVRDLRNYMENSTDFSGSTVENICRMIKKDNIDLAQKIIKDSDFSRGNISEILRRTDGNNVEAKIELYNFIKKNKEKLESNWVDYSFYLLANTNHHNIKLAKKIVQEDDFPKEFMQIILYNTNKYNEQDKKIEMFDFLKEHKKEIGEDWKCLVNDVVSYVTPTNFELAKKMILNKDFPNDEIGKTLPRINERNFELAKLLLEDKDFPKDTLKTALSDLSEDDVKAKIEIFNFIKTRKAYFKEHYKETLKGGVLSARKNNIELKQKMFYKVLSFKNSALFSSSVLQKTTAENADNVQFVIDEIQKNKNKFERDYISAASYTILNEEFDLFKRYLNNEKWNTNETIRKLIRTIIQDDKLKEKEHFIEYVLNSNFDSDEISRCRKENYHTAIRRLQNTNDYEIIFRRIDKISDKKELSKYVRLKANGEIIKSTSESTKYSNGTLLEENHINGGNYSSFLVYDEKTPYWKTLLKETKVVSNDSGPTGIFRTKASPLMKGVFDVTFYSLDEIDENIDLLDETDNKKIKGLELSRTEKTPEGDIIHTDLFQKGEYQTKREYRESEDGSKTSLNYAITNLKGEKLVDIKRTFEIKGNKTITTINGKKYTTLFFDESKTAIIQDEKGFFVNIDFSGKTTFGEKEEIWNLIKKSPADIILNLNNIEKIEYDKEECSWCYKSGGIIFANWDVGALSHEIGHYRDTTQNGRYTLDEIYEMEKVSGEERNAQISSNPDLIKIYNEEMKDFKDNISEEEKQNIWYFSQTGGSSGTGLAELVAEVNAIFTVKNVENMETRDLYLMKFFPKTIIKTAELLGYK